MCKYIEYAVSMIIVTANSDQVSDRPSAVQLQSPSGTPMVFDSASNASTIEETETTMIDMQYEFWLSENDKAALRQRYMGLAEDEHSINQTTTAYTKDVPFFVDFVLETRGAEDP